jgi:hypothetical protein
MLMLMVERLVDGGHYPDQILNAQIKQSSPACRCDILKTQVLKVVGYHVLYVCHRARYAYNHGCRTKPSHPARSSRHMVPFSELRQAFLCSHATR